MHQWFQSREWSQGWEGSPDSYIDVQTFFDQFHKFPDRWRKAFEYLKNTNLEILKPGEYEIQGKDVFVKVQEYMTKDETDTKYESHENYADLQLLVKGIEKIGVAPVNTLYNQVPYDEKSDIAFYTSVSDNYRIATPGKFFIFFPQNGHRPCVKSNSNSEVKKIVIKIKVKDN